MTLNEYQILAGRTINHGLSAAMTQLHALHEMASEVGDLLWGIAELCTVRGWCMDDVAAKNIQKLKKRYPDGFDAERSLHREVEK